MIFGISYVEWIGYIAVVIFVFLFGLPNGWLKRLEKYYSSDHLHQKLTSEEVRTVTLRNINGEERILSEEEQAEVVAWFNSAKLVQKAKELEAANSAVLQITRKDGLLIQVVPYRNDVIIRRPDGKRSGESVSYWAKQDTLSRLLREEEGRFV